LYNDFHQGGVKHIKKTTKHYSQKMYLFVIYGTFILVLLAIFFTITYTYYQKNALEDTVKELENVCASAQNSITAQLDNIATISMNIVYSNAVKNNFKEFSTYYQQSGIDPSGLAASHEKAVAIHDIVTAMVGAYQTATEVNIYTMDGSCVESGYWQRVLSVNLEEMPWYEQVMALNGYKYITLPATRKDLPAKGANQQSRKFISLVRLFLTADGQPEGIVEVVQDCDTIFSLISSLEQQNTDIYAYVYNDRGELIYPYDDQLISSNRASAADCYSVVAVTGKIPEYDWTVFIAKPKDAAYQTLKNFQKIFIVVGISSILLTMFVCFFISERLTVPLQKLTEATGKITLSRVLDENKVNLTTADSSIQELSQLCESIRDMYEKLRSTSQEVLLSRSEETKAKLQATQSLINPHFLYNCLTSISIMAEENMNENITAMCQALCDYFRYISSSRDMLVPLEEEIFYTRRYLESMQLRFTEEFSYTLNIAADSRQLIIPKLILQPIVENAFKYAFNMSPPWQLTITSATAGDCWIIKVEDNGGRLSDEKKQELLYTFDHLDMDEELHSLEIGGMGLKNVYLRLKLLYGRQAIFQIENQLPGKTIFLLGGPVYYSREEYDEQYPKL